ncbi:MAG TPA: zinc-binding alcohol dehydrogenase [Fimbriimonas sp.]
MQTRSILFTGPDQVELADVEVPAPGPGEILLETVYSVVSPGTEIRCLEGGQPGSPDWPYIPGYSMVGRVVARGEGASLEEGTLVFCAGTRKAGVALCWGGHIGHAVVPEADAYVVPAGVDTVTAGMAHLVAIAVRGVRLTKPTLYCTVAVLGLGPIGQLSARLFAATDAKTIAVDLVPERVQAAQSAGIRAYLAKGDPAEVVREFFPDGADIVVDATGSPQAIHSSIAAARDKPWDDSRDPGPRIVIQGSYPNELPIPYQEAFLKEATFLLPRSCQPSDVRLVLELLADGRLRVGDIVSRVYAPAEAPKAYEALRRKDQNFLTVAFQWH